MLFGVSYTREAPLLLDYMISIAIGVIDIIRESIHHILYEKIEIFFPRKINIIKHQTSKLYSIVKCKF
jgi:hypothetical protein